jgi:hypothetical protein
MHRTLIAVSFSILALASNGRSASAQQPAARDSVAHSTYDTGPVIDTASRKVRVDGDFMLANCVGGAHSAVGFVLPLFCARRVNGVFDRGGVDSVTFLGGGHQFRLPARDVRAVTALNRQRRANAMTGVLIGGGVGVIGAAFAGLRGISSFGYSAVVLGGTGALIGGLAGSRYGGGWPRVLEDARH